MNNIEKQAERFGMEEDDGFAVMNADKRDGFKAGAEWMHAELTRWHDPKEEAPEFLKDVLFKIRYRGCARIFYVVGYLKESGTIVGPCGLNYEIIGWREIHE